MATVGSGAVLRLPESMLARAGAIPAVGGWSFEPKLDGFRCLVCTHDGRFRARSRRGWDMRKLLPELASVRSCIGTYPSRVGGRPGTPASDRTAEAS